MTPDTLQQFSAILLRARKAGMGVGLIHPCLLLHTHVTLTCTDIARMMGVNAAGITGTIDRMAAAGWVERQNSVLDRRVRVLSVTEKGRAVFKKVFNEPLEA